MASRAEFNGKVSKIKATQWFDRYKRVEQLTWAPGFPDIIYDRHIVDGGWFDRPGGKCFNLYRLPTIVAGDASKAGPWINHLNWLYAADDARHITTWLAHRTQRPGEKPNHALVMGGAQGIGKDLIFAPVREAVGTWNFHDVSPATLMEPFTPFVRSVILRVNEAHDLGDSERVNRYVLYERTKIYAAAPPEVLRCHEKHLRPYYVFNVLGLLITTNHKAGGIYLPAEDRRYYVAWSNRIKEEFSDDTRNKLWHWLRHEGGHADVAAYLRTYDISGFDPFAPPPKTSAFKDIVAANIAPEDTELGDALEALGNPDAVTVLDIVTSPHGASLEWLLDRKHRRAIPYRFERCGYVPCHNPKAGDGRWKIGGEHGKNLMIYVKVSLTPGQQLAAASKRRDSGLTGGCNDEGRP